MKRAKGGPLWRFFQRHGWCQGVFARSKYGRPVKLESPRASAFCLRGACQRIGLNQDEIGQVIAKAENSAVCEFNDRTGMTKRKIMEFLLKHGL